MKFQNVFSELDYGSEPWTTVTTRFGQITFFFSLTLVHLYFIIAAFNAMEFLDSMIVLTTIRYGTTQALPKVSDLQLAMETPNLLDSRTLIG